jgi:Ser/Thr protein kinase RdoA (MazF antagonist)
MNLAECLASWLDEPVVLERRIFNGDEAEVWKASATRGHLAVHISPPWRNQAELAWCHAVASHAGSLLEAVVVPLEVKGSTMVRWNGRLVTLSEWVEGTMADRTEPAQVAAAGRLLADIHAALLAWPGPPRPPNPARTSLSVVVAELTDPELDAWWSARTPRLVRGVCHGDYYRRNLLVDEGEIRGVIDWHEARLGPLIGEVAFAAWEFGHDDDMNLVFDRFDCFVTAYRGRARHLSEEDYGAIYGAVRVSLRDNIMYALAHGASPDDDYQHRQIRAFGHLDEQMARLPG